MLRNLRKSHGQHFRRQAPIGPYFADFCCHSTKVIIEADGLQHGGPSDDARDAWLAKAGYTTYRFSNWQIINEWESVVMTLEKVLGLEDDLTPPTPNPSPQGGGE